jgi:hypothetical protein
MNAIFARKVYLQCDEIEEQAKKLKHQHKPLMS